MFIFMNLNELFYGQSPKAARLNSSPLNFNIEKEITFFIFDIKLNNLLLLLKINNARMYQYPEHIDQRQRKITPQACTSSKKCEFVICIIQWYKIVLY